MQSFTRRLKFYGIGFGFGLLFVIFFFKNRGCSWLPSTRVKNSVLERVIVVPDDQEAAMSREGISDSDILYLIENGDIDFSQSIKRTNPKVYLFEGEIKVGKELKLFMTLPSESFISEVHFKESEVQNVKNTNKGTGKMISFPKGKQLIFIDSTDLLRQHGKEYKIPNSSDLLSWLKSSGKIDFSRTNFRSKPKVEHLIWCKDNNGKGLAFKAVWYKEKINVTSFDF
jgi:hypothetical protein